MTSKFRLCNFNKPRVLSYYLGVHVHRNTRIQYARLLCLSLHVTFCILVSADKPMISTFECLASISPNDKNQFKVLRHKVENNGKIPLNFLKLTFYRPIMHIKSNSEFNSQLHVFMFY